MAGVLDQLEAQDTSEQNALLERAAHDRSWANTFVSTPPAEVLRANQNYEDLLATAADRKRQLIQMQGPVRDQLTLAQIEHQNAMTSRENFKAIEDQRLSRQADDLYAGLADLKTKHEPDSPEYQSGLLDLIHKNHEAARRDPGIQEELRMTAQSMSDKSYWTRFNQIHKEASVLARTRGVDVQYVNGEPSIEATQAYADSLGKGESDTGKGKNDPVARELMTLHKITPNELLNPISVQYGNMKGTSFEPDAGGKTGGKIAQIDVGRGTPVQMSAAEFARYSKAFTPATAESAQPSTTRNISQADYEKLKPGDPYQWNGKTLTKK